MNLYENIQAVVQDLMPNIACLLDSDTGERKAPYIVIAGQPLEERIKSNQTWEYAVTVTLTANAHDWGREKFNSTINSLYDSLRAQLKARLHEKPSEEYLLYTANLTALNEVEVSEDDYTQTINLTALVQQ